MSSFRQIENILNYPPNSCQFSWNPMGLTEISQLHFLCFIFICMSLCINWKLWQHLLPCSTIQRGSWSHPRSVSLLHSWKRHAVLPWILVRRQQSKSGFTLTPKFAVKLEWFMRCVQPRTITTMHDVWNACSVIDYKESLLPSWLHWVTLSGTSVLSDCVFVLTLKCGSWRKSFESCECEYKY